MRFGFENRLLELRHARTIYGFRLSAKKLPSKCCGICKSLLFVVKDLTENT
jgi:hypothetical protein